ncbi:amino acid adenylation domain-containing protein [Pseudonocardia sp. MCCB 268]|nr:amino acid adenylation domain-containing protein [Pseudonocardia cytotoxica]
MLDRLPAHGRVPLGRPVRNNTAVRVVDENLAPVPLARRARLFSPGCVGRGYIGDPERTPGRRSPSTRTGRSSSYRSGDHGRWLPGRHRSLGRRDTQVVKIRGFRIGDGEIENTRPGARRADAAVVVTEGPTGGKHLVAFYAAGSRSRTLLRERLPRRRCPATWCPPRSTTGPRSRSPPTAKIARRC